MSDSYWRGKYIEARRIIDFLLNFIIALLLILAFSMFCVIKASAAEVTQEEKDLLCRCVMAEAGNQSEEGKRAVAEVVLNRVDDKSYADSITGVVTEKGEFSSWANGSIDKVIPTQSVIDAVDTVLAERTFPADVLWFRTKKYHGWGTPWKKIGDHYFSRK